MSRLIRLEIVLERNVRCGSLAQSPPSRMRVFRRHSARWSATEDYKVKNSYLDDAGQLNCNSEVEQAEPQDIDKTLGQEPVGQIGAAAHISFNQTER